MKKYRTAMEINKVRADRRKSSFDRRNKTCRRLRQERRVDRWNLLKVKYSLSFRNRIRALLNPRSGVDRRKAEQRIFDDRRGMNPASLLTKEELADLLAE